MLVFHSVRYHIDIGTHIFPTAKYARVVERLQRQGPSGLWFVEPDPASWEDLALVHSPEYLNRLQTGAFSTEELALLEVPWSPDIVEGFRLMTGGTVLAARAAAGGERVACHVGGGLHHAFADHGEGFCLFNDVAVAIQVLFRDRLASSAAVIDLDVHHGNGTAFLFERDPRVFTFSMHQQFNYPMHKPRGSLDIGLADGTRDEEYVARLTGALPRVFEHQPDIVFYLAGADPYEDDQLGGLALTKAGLRQRDGEVLHAAWSHGVPVVLTLAGGYARRLEDTVDIHCATVVAALQAR